MATPEKLLQVKRARNSRYFSEEFKRQKVREIEKNQVSISELTKEYQVSRTSIYRWIFKYSKMIKKGERQIVEKKSDTRKLQELRDRIKELERVVGQKQLLIEFQQKMIDMAEEAYDIDIKKKLSSRLSSGIGPIDPNTPGQ